MSYTRDFFISNFFISNQAQIMKKLRKFLEIAETEIIETLRNLRLIPTQESKEILKKSAVLLKIY